MNAIVLFCAPRDPGAAAAARAAVAAWTSQFGVAVRTPWIESAPGASHAARRRSIDAVLRLCRDDGVRLVVAPDLRHIAPTAMPLIRAVAAITDTGAAVISVRERIRFDPPGARPYVLFGDLLRALRDLDASGPGARLRIDAARRWRGGRPGWRWTDADQRAFEALRDAGVSVRAIARDRRVTAGMPDGRRGAPAARFLSGVPEQRRRARIAAERSGS